MRLYNLREIDRQSAVEQGVATVVAVILKVLFEGATDKEAGVKAFRDSVAVIMAQMMPDVPKENRNAYLKAAQDRADDIIKMALNLTAAPPTSDRLQ